MRPCSLVALSAVLIPAIPVHTQGPVSWEELTPAAAPSARSYSRMVHDDARGEILLFGGVGVTSFPHGDTWRWDGTNWIAVAAGGSGPPARWNHGMAYDAARQRTVIYGGAVWDNTPSAWLVDTWTWDGTTWAQGEDGPGQRAGHAMAYDPVSQRVILFGGANDGVERDDTWAWDGSTWTELFPNNKPLARDGVEMALDTQRKRIVLFGGERQGTYFSDTWEWNDSDWQPMASAGPPGRWGHSMAYDAYHQRVIVVGGYSSTTTIFGDTWEWDGSTWTEMPTPQGASAPIPRVLHALAYSPITRRTLLFGGLEVLSTPGENDTWALQPDGTYNTFGNGCAGTNGTPTLSEEQAPALGESFSIHVDNVVPGSIAVILVGLSNTSLGGIPLPISLWPAFPACKLHTSAEFALQFPVGPLNGFSWGFPIPHDPAFVGVTLHNQVFLGEPTGMISATNGGTAIVGY